MCRIDQAQNWTANSELYLIAAKELNGAGDALTIDERPIETLQVSDRELITALFDLGMMTRDDGGTRIDQDLVIRPAPEARDLSV